MDRERVRTLIRQLYETVDELEAIFSGRPFTPDGHMVGSIGECLVAEAYDLDLMPPSNQGYDAVAKDGRQVEIKATQGNRVGFRSCPTHTIIVKIHRDGTIHECYNGPGDIIWQQFEGKPLPSNGQYQISLNRIRELTRTVPDGSRIPRLQESGGGAA
jgi:hypothetical protein